MLRRAWQPEAGLVFATFEVEVGYARVGVGICAVETDTFQSRGYETEVTLQRHFDAEQVALPAFLGCVILSHV
mgnify:CR=1 FL=1